jgi:hypothetical protein
MLLRPSVITTSPHHPFASRLKHKTQALHLLLPFLPSTQYAAAAITSAATPPATMKVLSSILPNG